MSFLDFYSTQISMRLYVYAYSGVTELVGAVMILLYEGFVGGYGGFSST